MKKYIALVLAAVLVLGILQDVADTEQLTTENGQESSVLACPSVNGKLHVEGSKLVDQNNNEVQLRGVSTHGLAWYPQYVTNDCLPR